MGMKSASLNHAKTLVVISRQGNSVSGRRWTAWNPYRRLEVGKSSTLQGRLSLSTAIGGSLILANRGQLCYGSEFHAFKRQGPNAGRTFAAYSKVITKHLGLVFHRFIRDGRIEIYLDLQEVSGDAGLPIKVEPLYPFPKASSGKGYPAEFHTNLSVYGDLAMRAYIWPPNTSDPGYKLGGRVSQRQGFYFFRNDRLIQAGGWNGWRDDAEPPLFLLPVSRSTCPPPSMTLSP